MKVEMDPASAQAFMAMPLKVERNGMSLTMGSALVALDIDPWSLAGELACASRRKAVTRLELILRKTCVGLPEAGAIARQAIASLPQPSTMEGADLATIVRVAFRDPELIAALLCFTSVTAQAILLMLFVLAGSVIHLLGGYCLIAVTWAALPQRCSVVLRVHWAVSSSILGLIFAAVRFAT